MNIRPNLEVRISHGRLTISKKLINKFFKKSIQFLEMDDQIILSLRHSKFSTILSIVKIRTILRTLHTLI